MPSNRPTTTPTLSPSALPSFAPSYPEQELLFFIQFRFDALSDLDDKPQRVLEKETASVVEKALEIKYPNIDFEVLAVVKGSVAIGTIVAPTRTRKLQTSSTGLEVLIELYVTMRSETTFTLETMRVQIGTAFDATNERTSFIVGLQQKDTAFNRVNAVVVIINDEEVVLIEQGTSAWIYIGVGIGAAVAAIASFFFIGYRRRRSNQIAYIDADTTTVDGGIRGPIPFFSMDEDQDISTIGAPEVGGQTMFVGHFGQESDQETGDDVVAEYNFGLAYGGAGDLPSVSSTGGTKATPATPALGDVSMEDVNRPRDKIDSEEISQISSIKEDLSLFRGDDSFDRLYGEDERIDVIAPAGKLGVVIDTPMNGAPIVHAIKELSVLADRVRIGDKLVSVDGQDTTDLSAIRVSKLISSKAMNEERHMVFMRPASHAAEDQY